MDHKQLISYVLSIKYSLKRYVLLTSLWIMLISCQAVSSPVINPDVPNETVKPLTSTSPTITSESIIYPTPVVLNSPPANLNIPTPHVSPDGSFGLYTIGFARGSNYCNEGYVEELNYSPDYELILVLVHCFEEQNQLFLLNSHGTGLLREITADSWEAVLGNQYSWSPDGESIVYLRTVCCSDAALEVKTGFVRYDVRTADRKLLISSAPPISYSEGRPVWSPDGQWIAFLSPEARNYPCTSLYVVDKAGSILWKFEKFCLKKVRWSQANLIWEIENESTLLLRLGYAFDGKVFERIYHIDDGKPDSASVIYLTPIPEIDQP